MLNVKTDEIWKDVKGYEGHYMVSNAGRVLNIKRGNYLKPSNMNGYLQVGLFKEGVQTKKRVHRLVAEAFLPNQCNAPMVNHKDECKHNNVVSNLEWCDARYNVEYSKAKKFRLVSPCRYRG